VIERIGVLGAGVMGAGIAQVTATAGFETRCFDPDGDARAKGLEHATAGRYGLDRGVERGKLSADDAAAARRRLSFVDSLEDAVGAADLVIEAVPERLDLKIRVFRDLDRVARPDAILASNTSGLPITAMAAATDRPPPGGRLALGVARGRHALRRDRARPGNNRRHHRCGPRRRDPVRQEPHRRT
jgi:3-hydroxybutyryl-CoA dehydrogenase